MKMLLIASLVAATATTAHADPLEVSENRSIASAPVTGPGAAPVTGPGAADVTGPAAAPVTGPAAADVTASGAAALPAPTTYVQGGLMVGGNDGYVTAGGSAEVGRRVAPLLWLHGSITDGIAEAGLFTSGTGSILQVRAGMDLMSCGASGAVCGFAGADAGFQRTQFEGEMFSAWSGDTSSGNTHIDDSANRLIGVARVGLDIGNAHLRWRPGIELAVAGDGVNGANLTQSIAYRF